MPRDAFAEQPSTPTRERGESGSIGIGAMIVFIALILVAAVASTIIIKTAEELQQNAENTSQDTREQISGKVSIVDIFVKSAADPLSVSASNTDVATMDVIARVASGSLGVEDGDITWYISCKVTYTTGSGTFAVIDSGTADALALPDTTVDSLLLVNGDQYSIVTVNGLTWTAVGSADSAVGTEFTATGLPGAALATGGLAQQDSYFDGAELAAGTTFKFEIDLSASDSSGDSAITVADFALGQEPGCDAEAGTGATLELRIVVAGGGETLATLNIDSLTLGSSMM